MIYISRCRNSLNFMVLLKAKLETNKEEEIVLIFHFFCTKNIGV